MTVTRTPEVKEIKPEETLKKLKESVKPTPFDPNEISKLSVEDRLKLCQITFNNDEFIQIGKNYFNNYIDKYGTTEPTFSSLVSFFGGKTNQPSNYMAFLAIGDPATQRRELLPSYIFDVLCKLKDIQKTAKSGETVDVINSIISSYRLPLDNEKFNVIKSHLVEALKHFELFIAGGLVPVALKRT